MKNIIICKEKYDYFFQTMHDIIKKKLGNIEKIYYWTNNKGKNHHIYLCGSNRNLSVNLCFSNKFKVPEHNTLMNDCNWSVTLPEEYDASYFIHEIIFRQNGKKPARPVKTLIGISPDIERCMQKEFRKKVKLLTLSLACEVENGRLAYDTAAIHFSASTGLHIINSRRFFRQFNNYALYA
ncbi:hypothetical protein VQ300_004805 [Salmonella enterica]|nr:hypothetical protein [Salmonella enterica]